MKTAAEMRMERVCARCFGCNSTNLQQIAYIGIMARRETVCLCTAAHAYSAESPAQRTLAQCMRIIRFQMTSVSLPRWSHQKCSASSAQRIMHAISYSVDCLFCAFQQFCTTNYEFCRTLCPIPTRLGNCLLALRPIRFHIQRS